MTRLALAAAVLTACSFSAQPADPGAVPDGGAASTSDSATPFVGCHVHDTSLRLCLDFEDPALSPVVRDGSSFGHDASTENLAPMTRAGEQAAMFGSSSQATIQGTPDFTLPKLSIEAWIQTDNVWTDSWALHDGLYYGLGVAGGSFVCAAGDKVASADATRYAGQWTHIACTNDGDHLTLYINGDAADCTDGFTVKATDDLSVGDNLEGGLDDVRLYAAAIAPADVCAHAGRSGCAASCPE